MLLFVVNEDEEGYRYDVKLTKIIIEICVFFLRFLGLLNFICVPARFSHSLPVR